jgi:hypothetical protein
VSESEQQVLWRLPRRGLGSGEKGATFSRYDAANTVWRGKILHANYLRGVADYLTCIGHDRYNARLGCVTDLGGIDDD